MNCALWLNKQKVRHASEIPQNLDVASLRGYFLAGSLLKWLRENGGEEYAEKLSAISADDEQLNQKIADIFGSRPLRSKPMQKASEKLSAPPHTRKPDKTEQSGLCGSTISSYPLPSSGSFGFANYGSGSFNMGSYSQWEWLFSLLGKSYGSFVFGSFSSYHEWEWEWFFRLFTSGGSFARSSFGSFYTQFLNGIFGSFSPFNNPERFPVLDEYDRIMLETLMKCPLDGFGYGIHNI